MQLRSPYRLSTFAMESPRHQAPENDPQSAPSPEVASNSELPWRQRFAHGMFDWGLENRVTARELAMLRVMNSITDKPGWEANIFDDEVAALWKAEAIASERLMSWRAWAWCLEELRDKAIEFSKTGRVVVYDVGPSISKSRLDGDAGRLKALVQKSIERAASGDGPPDWQLDGDTQVFNMIDPSLYPLAYGITTVLPEGEKVNLDRPWDKLDQGLRSAVVPHALEEIFRREGLDPDQAPEILHEQSKFDRWRLNSDRWAEDMPWRYSNRFQWLPCDVKFTDPNSQDDCKVKIDGYINNLHPTSHRDLYPAIEAAISTSIQSWNDTVTYGVPGGWNHNGRWGKPKTGLGRASPRIRSFSLTVTTPLPPNGICFREKGNFYKELQDLSDSWDQLEPDQREDTLDGIIARMDSAKDLVRPLHYGSPMGDPAYRQEIQTRVEKFLHKEPGALYSYQEWKLGTIPPEKDRFEDSVGRDQDEEAVKEREIEAQRLWAQIEAFKATLDVKPEELRDLCGFCPCPIYGEEWELSREEHAAWEENSCTVEEYKHEYRHAQLQRDFRSQGLQVFVKMQSIEITPEKPYYNGSDWAIEGLLNEHIVANSICFFDVENVTDATVFFRVQTAIAVQRDTPPGSELRNRMISMYAIDDVVNHDGDELIPHMQTLGCVSVSEGRSISFPNTLQYRMGPVKLNNPSKPGHIRFLTLCLVDPNYRLVSTNRVVPQRFDWWMQEIFPWVFLMSKGLPVNVVDKIADEARGEHIVAPHEARAFRTRMLRERERMMAELNCSIYHSHFRDPESPSYQELHDTPNFDELWGPPTVGLKA